MGPTGSADSIRDARASDIEGMVAVFLVAQGFAPTTEWHVRMV